MFPSRSMQADSGVSQQTTNKLQAQMLKFMEGMTVRHKNTHLLPPYLTIRLLLFMQGSSKTTVILGTNRPRQLDPALLSRCAAAVNFDLPDTAQRAAIWKRYAKHLPEDGIRKLADTCSGFSGRDIKRVCEWVERMHAANIQRQGKTTPSTTSSTNAIPPPSLEEYVTGINERVEGVLSLFDPYSPESGPISRESMRSRRI
jgi:SpoVK/Ycf46/Vps4 family AAA+-type ATPase